MTVCERLLVRRHTFITFGVQPAVGSTKDGNMQQRALAGVVRLIVVVALFIGVARCRRAAEPGIVVRLGDGRDGGGAAGH